MKERAMANGFSECESKKMMFVYNVNLKSANTRHDNKEKKKKNESIKRICGSLP